MIIIRAVVLHKGDVRVEKRGFLLQGRVAVLQGAHAAVQLAELGVQRVDLRGVIGVLVDEAEIFLLQLAQGLLVLRAEEFSRSVNVKTPSISQLVGNLSGGNQQKVVIAKLLCRDPEILIFDEPTVGIDVGAKQEIFKLIERLTERGRGVILISSYLPEVMGLSDRLIVMAQGKITAEYDKEALKTLTEADVLRMASIED